MATTIPKQKAANAERAKLSAAARTFKSTSTTTTGFSERARSPNPRNSRYFGSEFFRSALGEGRFLSEVPNGAGREVNQTLPLETLVAEEFLQIQPCVGLDFPFYKLLFELAALEVNHAV